jgi:hypothetical protein
LSKHLLHAEFRRALAEKIAPEAGVDLENRLNVLAQLSRCKVKIDKWNARKQDVVK